MRARVQSSPLSEGVCGISLASLAPIGPRSTHLRCGRGWPGLLDSCCCLCDQGGGSAAVLLGLLWSCSARCWFVQASASKSLLARRRGAMAQGQGMLLAGPTKETAGRGRQHELCLLLPPLCPGLQRWAMTLKHHIPVSEKK